MENQGVSLARGLLWPFVCVSILLCFGHFLYHQLLIPSRGLSTIVSSILLKLDVKYFPRGTWVGSPAWQGGLEPAPAPGETCELCSPFHLFASIFLSIDSGLKYRFCFRELP